MSVALYPSVSMAGAVPKPTERLIFRTWNAEEDGALAVGLWGDRRVTEFIGGPFEAAAVAARLADECQRLKDEGVQYWPVFVRDVHRDGGFGEHVGAVGLRHYGGEAPSCAGLPTVFEIGFHLRPDHWGKGLATEAATSVLTFALTELRYNAIFAGHNPKNKKSPRVLSAYSVHHRCNTRVDIHIQL